MSQPGARDLFLSSRGRKLIWKRSLQFLALPLALLCIAIFFFPEEYSLLITIVCFLIILSICLLAAIVQLWPHESVEREFAKPRIKIKVEVGDIFEHKNSLVIGFSDAFDTDISEGTIIAPDSVQGQFTQREYAGDWEQLDQDLQLCLSTAKTKRKTDKNKNFGNKIRYPIGTVAVLNRETRRFYCLAYTEMGYDKKAQGSLDTLWNSLSRLWEAIDLYDHDGKVSIPVIGTERARIGCLEEESVIKIIALSFFARSERSACCKELSIVVYPEKRKDINMLEIKAFLNSLK